jgi:hypothetical protein
VPALAFGGDCDVMADAAELSAVVGTALHAPADLADAGVRTLGGIMCVWPADGGDIFAYALPASVVPPDVRQKYGEPVCEGFFYDGSGCRVGIADEETWMLVTAGSFLVDGEVDEGAVGERLAAVVPTFEAALPAAGSPAAADRTSNWWSSVTCEELGARVPLASLIDGDIQEGYPSAFGTDVPSELAERLGTKRFCPWYARTASGAMEAVVITAYPGGGWDFERKRAQAATGRELTPLTVDGATSAVTGVGGIRPDQSYLLAMDGVNLLEQLEAPDAAAAASAFIAGLAAGGD